MPTKCPKCGQPLLGLLQHRTNVHQTFNEAGFPVIQLKCGNINCQELLGFTIDHWAMVDDVANQVVKKLTKGR